MARKKRRYLLWPGLLLGLAGGLGQIVARSYIEENPEMYMGAMLAGLFETTRHLSFFETAVVFFAYYGLHLALAGAVLALFGLIHGR